MKYGNLSVRLVSQNILRVDKTFAIEGRLQTHRPRIMLRVVVCLQGCKDKELRHATLVEIVANGEISRTHTAIDERHSLVLNELARLLYRLWWAKTVIQAYQRDLSPSYTAVVIDHLNVSKLSPANCTPGGGRAAISHRLADLDLSIGDASRIALLGGHRTCCNRHDAQRQEALS